MVEDRVEAAEQRLDAIEADLVKIRKSLHRARNLTAKMGASLRSDITTISKKQDEILVFVSGANNIFGFARKHWKRILSFGAGFFTAAGIGNPKVIAFIIHFFGL